MFLGIETGRGCEVSLFLFPLIVSLYLCDKMKSNFINMETYAMIEQLEAEQNAIHTAMALQENPQKADALYHQIRELEIRILQLKVDDLYGNFMPSSPEWKEAQQLEKRLFALKCGARRKQPQRCNV